MQKQLLTSGNTFRRTDGRWNGVVWYMDEQGERKRKSFSGTSRQEVKEKITAYIAAFNQQLTASDESNATMSDSMDHWQTNFGRLIFLYCYAILSVDTTRQVELMLLLEQTEKI